MTTEVKLPDLGEGIEDVTISRWRVKEGDSVQAGDVILEVATDKVDTEVNAPASGKLLKIKYHDGEMAPASAVLALIGAEGEQVNGAAAPATPPAAPSTAKAPASKQKSEIATPSPTAAPAPKQEAEAAAPPSTAEDGQGIKATPVAKRLASELGVPLEKLKGTGPGGNITKDDVQTYRDSAQEKSTETALPDDLADTPNLTVQRLAAEHNINLAKAFAGRPLSTITRYDVLAAAGLPVPAEQQIQPTVAASAPAAKPTAPVPAAPASAPAPSPAKVKANEELVPHSRMRQLVAQNTSKSVFTAPHVTSMWDVDMSAVLTHRKAHKGEYATAGLNLTVTPYLIQAIIAGLQAVPAANATWTEEGVIIKRYYHIGMAVAQTMDKYGMGGLIVPVIKNAGDLNLMGLTRAVNDLSERARTNKLTAEELQGGTFTLTNYGTSGSRFQTPVIVQPQVGILGTGAIEKRPIVVSNGSPLDANLGDYLTFKPMMTLGFSYDHRVLDGATADAFCAAVKNALEHWQ